MDDINRKTPSHVSPLEREFRGEEAVLRQWLGANVTDPGIRKRHLAHQLEDHVGRGRKY